MDNDSELRLRNAQWFAGEMATLSSENQAKVLRAKTIDDIRQVYGAGAERLWTAREDWQTESSLGNHIEIPEPRTQHINPNASSHAGGSTGGAAEGAVGAGVLGFLSYDYLKNRKYYGFKNEAEKFAKNKVKEWKNNPDQTYAKSADGAWNRAINEYNERFLADNPEQAIKWARQHNDPSLQKAIRKKEILDKPNIRRDKDDLDEFLRENEIKNPEKTHAPKDDITQAEAEKRLREASEIGKSNVNSPEATAEYLARIKADRELLPPESQLVVPSSGSIAKAPQQTSQKEESAPPPSTQSRQPSGSPNSFSILRQRGKRANRRYGPGGFAKSIAKNTAKKGVKRAGGWLASWIAANPWIAVGIGIVIAIIVGFFLIIAAILNACENFWDDPIGNAPLAIIGNITGLCNAPYEARVPANPPGITTEKKGPYSVGNSTNILYEITVKYDPSVPGAPPIDELILFDVPLFDNQFVSATGEYSPGTSDSGFNYVGWDLSDNQQSELDYEFNFNLILDPSEEDFVAVNAIYVSNSFKEVSIEYRQTGGGGNPDDLGPGSTDTGPAILACEARSPEDIWHGADCLPTSKTCNGRWEDQMTNTETQVKRHINAGRLQGSAGTGYNFGDPMCTYNRARLKQIIDAMEENDARANFWMDITDCEGSVNSFGDQTRPLGPAGKFQMNIGQPIVFKKWQPSQDLRGDIPWQRQIQVAIEWNNGLRRDNNDFGFWGSAMCLCWWPKYRNQPYCKDIVDKGPGSITGPRAPDENYLNCPSGTGLTCNTAVTCKNVTCMEIGRRGPQP